jgi:hypothetical protein
MFEQQQITVCESSSIKVIDSGVALPNRPARFVMLSNWNVENRELFTKKSTGATIEAANEEVYWGFHGVYAHQLFQSQTTPLIPVVNLSDIRIRSRAYSVIYVWYSYFY